MAQDDLEKTAPAKTKEEYTKEILDNPPKNSSMLRNYVGIDNAASGVTTKEDNTTTTKKLHENTINLSKATFSVEEKNGALESFLNKNFKTDTAGALAPAFYKMYSSTFGTVFGKPVAMNHYADPNERVFQDTILRNASIMSFVPGVPSSPLQDPAQREAIADMMKELEQVNVEIRKMYTEDATKSSGDAKAIKAKELQSRLIKHMIDAEIDLRHIIFKPMLADFISTVNMAINDISTFMSKRDGAYFRRIAPDFIEFNSINSSIYSRGFGMWVQQGTSVSEEVINNYQDSMLKEVTDAGTDIVKQFQFAMSGAGLGDVTKQSFADQQAGGGFKTLSAQGDMLAQFGNILNGLITGARQVWAKMFMSGSFNRRYNIKLKFQSPYGDNRSIFKHVLIPFAYALTMSLPRQYGINAYRAPFIFQIDIPGYFSSPCAYVSSFSFTKGGPDMLFNKNKMPLVIECDMVIDDLYSDLTSLEYSNYLLASQNLNTHLFFNNLAGMNMYNILDKPMLTALERKARDLLSFIPNYRNNIEFWKTNLLARLGTVGNNVAVLGEGFN